MSEQATFRMTQKPRKRFGFVNFVCLVLGIVFGLWAVGNGWLYYSLLIATPFLACAVPVTERSIPERVAMVTAAYLEERFRRNVIVSASGLGGGKGHFLDPASVISVAVPGARARIGLSVYPGSVVVYLTADGHPDRASASPAAKAAIDVKISQALSAALSALPSVAYTQLHLQSPRDPHIERAYVPTHFDPVMLGRVRDQDDSPEARITAAAQYAVRQAPQYGADTRGIWAIILPTPRHRVTRRVLDLTDPESFERSSVVQTLSAAQRELATAGVQGVRVLTPSQVSLMLGVFQLKDAGTVFTKARLDKEIAEAEGHDPEQQPYFPEHPFPGSVAAHSMPPAIAPGYLLYDGNAVVAGTITAVDGVVPAGFLEDALQPRLGMNGVVIGYSCYIELSPSSRARRGSTVRTRALISARNLVETNPEIENVELRQKLDKERQLRRDYHDVGAHVAQWQHYFIIVAETPEKADEAYNELVKRLRRYFDVGRFWLRKDIEEAYWLHFGIVLDAK